MKLWNLKSHNTLYLCYLLLSRALLEHEDPRDVRERRELRWVLSFVVRFSTPCGLEQIMMSLNSCHTVQKCYDENKVDSRSLSHLLVMILNSINDTRTKDKHLPAAIVFLSSVTCFSRYLFSISLFKICLIMIMSSLFTGRPRCCRPTRKNRPCGPPGCTRKTRNRGSQRTPGISGQ